MSAATALAPGARVMPAATVGGMVPWIETLPTWNIGPGSTVTTTGTVVSAGAASSRPARPLSVIGSPSIVTPILAR